jgi:hypothetical protein
MSIWSTIREASALPPGAPGRAELLDQAEEELAEAEREAEREAAASDGETPPA